MTTHLLYHVKEVVLYIRDLHTNIRIAAQRRINHSEAALGHHFSDRAKEYSLGSRPTIWVKHVPIMLLPPHLCNTLPLRSSFSTEYWDLVHADTVIIPKL